MGKEKNLDENYLICKPTQMLHMRSNPFSINIWKLFDAYLSKINPYDEESRTVSFTKPEYEELIGVSKLKLSSLKNYTSTLLKSNIEIEHENGYFAMNLFECCEVTKKGGINTIEFTCSQTARKLFFNLKNIRYIKYQYKNIKRLSGNNSLALYFYLLENEFRVKWKIELSKLRKTLFIDESQYITFKSFNQQVLKKAVDEINEHTNIKVTYKTVKKGKCVNEIEFLITKHSYEDGDDYLFNISNDKEINEVYQLYSIVFKEFEQPVISSELNDLIKKISKKHELFTLLWQTRELYNKNQIELPNAFSLNWILENASFITSKKIEHIKKTDN